MAAWVLIVVTFLAWRAGRMVFVGFSSSDAWQAVVGSGLRDTAHRTGFAFKGSSKRAASDGDAVDSDLCK